MNRCAFLARSSRNFCAKSSSQGANEQVIRSGGKSSYIGFGKFEGMSREGGNIQKGLEYLKEAMKVHATLEESPDQLRDQARYHHDIAMCHHRDGDVVRAIAEYEDCVAILQKLLSQPQADPAHAMTFKRARFDLSSAFSGMSVALADKSEDAGALDFAQRALEIRKSILGPNHPSVAECLNNLGGLYFRQSSFNKAAEMYQESLRILLTKTGGKEENKYVALAYYNIGLTYNKLGIKKGVDAIHKALLIAEHVWGPNHDQTIQIRDSFRQLSNSEKN